MSSTRSGLLVLALALALVACSGDDDADETTATSADPAGPTSLPSVSETTTTPSTTTSGPSTSGCADLPAGSLDAMADVSAATAIADNPLLSTLATAIEAAGLTESLDGGGPFTIFAPVDAAFGAFASEELAALLAEPATLTMVLSEHVIEGDALSAADLVAGGTIETDAGPLTVTASGDDIIVGGTAAVSCADIETSNATIHLIDTVLLPAIDDTEAVGGTRLYSVDLTTGAATAIGRIGGVEVGVLGLAFAPGAGPSTVYGLTDVPELITFDASDPSTLVSTVPITGVAEGSTLLAIDVSPADGRLLALSDASVLYTIDAATGAATAIGDGLATPVPDPGFGFDVAPATGQVRIDVATGEVLLVDPSTGGSGVGSALAFDAADVNAGATPRIVAIAHDTGTRLYVIDAATGSLSVQDSAGAGELATIGPLGVDLTDGASFDIAASGEALLASPG